MMRRAWWQCFGCPRGQPVLMLAGRIVALALTLAGAGAAAVSEAGKPVVVARVEERSLAEEIPIAGSVVARHRATLSTAVPGRVRALDADVGQPVQSGSSLLRLDDALARQELAAARASAAGAQARLDDASRRLQEVGELRAKQVVAQTELLSRRFAEQEARAEVTRWQAEVAQREELLQRHQLKAPFAGVLLERLADLGEWVVPGDPLFILVSTHSHWVDLQVPQQYFQALGEATELMLSFDGLPGRSIRGRIERIVPAAGDAARSFRIRAVPLAENLPIIPGMSARGRLQLSSEQQQLLVPRDALVRQADGSGHVWQVEKAEGVARVRRHQVQVGAIRAGWVAVLGSLPAGALVVVRGNENLQEGEAVQIVDQPR